MIFRRRKRADLSRLAEELEALSEDMLTADVYEYGREFVSLLLDNLDLIASGRPRDVMARINELRRLVRRYLLPLGAPMTVVDAVSLVVEASAREEAGPEVILSRLEALLTIALNYAESSVADVSMNLNYVVKTQSRVLTTGYSSFIERVLLTIRNRLSGVDTLYGRPFMAGKRLAVELASKGLEALAWPDVDVSNVVERVDHVLIFTPGIGGEGVAAAEPGSVAAVVSAKKREASVVLVSQTWSVTREPFGEAMDRRVAVYSKSAGGTIYLSPFDYIPLSLVDVLVTEMGTYSKPDIDKLVDVHSEMVRTLVSEAIRVSGV